MKKNRIASIDIFRALTMLLMIFVNDLWSLSNIPKWLEHKAAHEDGMGLADVVFPAFLFIVGLAIPYAIKARESKGDNTAKLFQHIFTRTIALLIMGYYIVNLDNINGDLTSISQPLWQILMMIAFFLIWNNYYNQKAFGKIPDWVMKAIGLAILGFLAYSYKSGTEDAPTWMQAHWWGILGLIGWSYGLCAVLYVLVKDKVLWIGVLTLVFYGLNVQEFLVDSPLIIVVSASNYACVMSGLFVSVVFNHLRKEESNKEILMYLTAIAGVLLIFGFTTRPEWGISKIQATPSWTAICSGISTLTFVLLFWVTDMKGWTDWANPLKPAGRSTLTCYLVPYFVYAFLMGVLNFEWPAFLSDGYVGLVKSLLFSLLIIYLTGLLDKFLKIRLSI